MEKEFIPYQPSFDMKELGFDEPCLGNYRLPSNRLITEWEIRNTPEHTLGIPAPLYQQCFRWFREKYNLHSNIISTGNEIGYEIWKFSEELDECENLNNYEEAELECLKKLIELCKNN